MPESDKNGYELVEFLRLAPSAMNNDNSNYNSNNKAAPPLPLSLPFLASLKTISIVLLTAKAMTDDWIKGYQAGAYSRINSADRYTVSLH
mmetsp:Transcript_23042/g.46947  ORF Transcript_23042/g.46947 Transcript_23042/m.46947 type:complete len:90 (-) Transcript_23042:39-308(-)